MCNNCLALTQTVMQRIKRECADRYMRVGMKRNCDRLTRVSQHQDKWQTWRKDVLRHTPRRNLTSIFNALFGWVWHSFGSPKNVATHLVLSRNRCKQRVLASESEAMLCYRYRATQWPRSFTGNIRRRTVAIMLKVVHVGKFREALPVGSPTDSFV